MLKCFVNLAYELFSYAGKSTCSVFALCPHHWFSSWSDKTVKRRGYGYESLKKAFGQTIWRQVEMLFPQLEGKVGSFGVKPDINTCVVYFTL